MVRRAGLAALVGLLMFGGCAPDRQQPAGGAGTAGGVPGTSASAPSPAFCDAVARILAAEADGFTGLREQPLGVQSWRGAVVPPGLQGCSIVGERRPAAHYVCWGETVGSRGELIRLDASFQRTVGHLDACLGAPSGQGAIQAGGFSRGPVLSFAGGERLALWRDRVASPTPGVALRIEEDTATGAYTMSLSAQTLR